MKKYIIGLITGIILCGVGVYAANYAANEISFTTNKNSNVKTVKDALDDLYSNANDGKLIYAIVGRQSGAGQFGIFQFNNFIDEEYIENNSIENITIKKNAKIKITNSIYDADASNSSKPGYNISKNNSVILTDSVNNGSNKISDVTIDVEDGDVISGIGTANGGSYDTIIVTTIQLIK